MCFGKFPEFQGFLLSNAKKLIGIEMNAGLCEVQKAVISKYDMRSRVEVISIDSSIALCLFFVFLLIIFVTSGCTRNSSRFVTLCNSGWKRSLVLLLLLGSGLFLVVFASVSESSQFLEGFF